MDFADKGQIADINRMIEELNKEFDLPVAEFAGVMTDTEPFVLTCRHPIYGTLTSRVFSTFFEDGNEVKLVIELRKAYEGINQQIKEIVN